MSHEVLPVYFFQGLLSLPSGLCMAMCQRWQPQVQSEWLYTRNLLLVLPLPTL